MLMKPWQWNSRFWARPHQEPARPPSWRVERSDSKWTSRTTSSSSTPSCSPDSRVFQTQLARLAASAEAVEFWEGRLNEIEFIAETTGKRAALAFAKSFYSGKSGFSTAHLIELNKRAKLCYRATKRHHSSTGSEDQSSSDFKARKQHHGKIWQKPPSFNRPRQESSQFSKGTTCFKCGEEGHVAYHCPSRKFGQ